MKTKVTGHKLENPTVNYISLVDRGANRIPFRIVKRNKGEASMGIDLGRIFKTAKPKEEDLKPTVVGLCVQKGVQDEAVRKAIESAGFKVDTIIERDDGTIIYSQAGNIKPEECLLVKMQSGLVLMMKGFDPYALMGENMPFDDIVKAQGFIPSVSVAFDALQNTMAGILFSAPTGGGDEVIGKVDQALGDFHQYVMAQAKAIPSAAFKAEHDIAELLKVEIKADEDVDAEDGEDEKPSAEAKATPEAGSGDKAADKETEGEEGKGALTAATVQAIAQNAVEAAMKPIRDSLNENVSMLKSLVTVASEQAGKFKELAANQTAFAQLQKELATKVFEVEGVAKSAEDKMKGTVVGGAPAGDRQIAKAEGQTNDDDPRQGTFDTAFLPPQWRQEHIRKIQDKSRNARRA